MDWRERNYYLVNLNYSKTDWWVERHDNYGIKHDTYLNRIRREVKSIKISAPYKHFKNNGREYDGDIKEIGYVQQMFSCKKSESELFEEFMASIYEHDKYTKIIKMSKEKCGQ